MTKNDTILYYFGARYYDSDLSSWLSVDPLAEARAWISPYNYSQNNPVGRKDPTGRLDDGYTVDKKGKIERVDNTGGKDFDVLYNKEKYDEGLRTYNDIGDANNGLKLDRGILNKCYICTDIRQEANVEQLLNPMTFYQFNNIENTELFFNFVTTNSGVEWWKYIQYSGSHFVSTNHLKSKIFPFMLFNAGIIKTQTKDMEHNHPSGVKMPSYNDIKAVKQFKQSKFYNNTTFRISTKTYKDFIYDENSEYIK